MVKSSQGITGHLQGGPTQGEIKAVSFPPQVKTLAFDLYYLGSVSIKARVLW